MRPSRADELALRRQLLVLDSSIQRLRLRRDVRTLAAALNPPTLALLAWQRVRTRPWFVLLPLAGIVALRFASVRRWSARALLLWRGWRAVRRWLTRSRPSSADDEVVVSCATRKAQSIASSW
jgi:hypothetical protein